ncbi:MAG TPA: site-specific integrase [Chryseolinea sp.]|nr:site-specific integrase [Chryseolinea sp.]
MKTTFNQSFVLRKTNPKQSALATVYLRMTVDGSRTEFSLQRQCDPQKWIPEKGRLNGKTEDVKSFNNYLQRVESKIYEIFQDFISSGIEFDGERIKARYLGFDVEKPRMFPDIYEDHNKEFQELVGRGLSYGTLQKYKTIKGYVAQFLKYKYAKTDIEITKLDYQFIKSFEIYLKTVKHCCHNTAMDYLKKIKKITNQCIAKKWIDRSPFVGFKMSVSETHKTFLNEEELWRIAEQKIAIKRLEQVRDIFLFSCYTGLSYCDVAKLTNANVVNGVDGEKWISTCRSKTNTPSKIPLLPISNSVINKYVGHPVTAIQESFYRS